MWLNYCCSMCWFSSLNSSCIIRNEGPIIVLWYILYIHIISGQWPHKLDDSEPEASSPIQRSLECFIEPCLLVFWWPIFFCWPGLFLPSQYMVPHVPRISRVENRNGHHFWVFGCFFCLKKLVDSQPQSQDKALPAVRERFTRCFWGYSLKVSDSWWLPFLNKSEKWWPRS